MKLHEMKERYIENPFKDSQVQQVLYHGTDKQFDRFDRKAHGIHVTPVQDWAREIYGNNVISLYADIRRMKVYNPADREVDCFYDRDYEEVARLIKQLEQEGYDAAQYGGESEAIALFPSVKIVHALTGKAL